MTYKKALTFSFDDGVLQDERLAKLLHKYGLKSTFNLNFGRLGLKEDLVCNEVTVDHSCIQAKDAARIYEGHEVAGHTLTHPRLTELSREEIIRQVEEDRIALSKLMGYEVVGFAYPCGRPNHDDRVVEILKEYTGIKYARTTLSTGRYEPCEDLIRLHPTMHYLQNIKKLFERGEEFLNLQSAEPQTFYIWGHAYELDAYDAWDEFEEFCRMISGRSDIFYGTNKDVLLGAWED